MAGGTSSARVWLVDEFGHGGIGRYAVDVANLVCPTADAVVATTDSGPVPGLRGRSVVWFRRGADSPVHKARAAVLGLLRAARSVRRGDVAWVPLGIRPTFEVLLVTALRLGGAAVVATVHNRAPHDREGDSLLVRVSARVARHVVVHTDAMQQWALDHRMHAVRLPFPPPDIAGSSRPPAIPRAELGVPEGAVLLAFLGYLYSYKGPDVLLRALALARRDDPDLPIHVLMAGRPAPSEDLGALVAELGLGDAVTLRPGWLEESTLAGMLGAADVLALPYRDIDNSGMGALARSWRVPVVASDLPLLRETFSPSAALFVRPGDPADLARALRELPSRLGALRSGAADDGGPDLEDPYRRFVEDLTSRTPSRRS
jgi:glycosyltransferase involved in cell wall biosynthesis